MKKGLIYIAFLLTLVIIPANQLAIANPRATSDKASMIIPTFNAVAAICQGANLEPLPTTSLEGVVGTWSPELNNTATTAYTFTPNNGQEATSVTMTIVVLPLVNPQPFCDYSNFYLTIDWAVVPGATSYAYSYTINGGEVQSGTTSISNLPLFSVQTNAAVVFTLTNIVGLPCFQPITITCGDLANPSFNELSFDFSPNPVADKLKVSCAKPLTYIEVYNELGQKLYSTTHNEKEVILDMSSFNSGIYLVKAHAENTSKAFKVFKN
jgi:hypothetical protein